MKTLNQSLNLISAAHNSAEQEVQNAVQNPPKEAYHLPSGAPSPFAFLQVKPTPERNLFSDIWV